MGKTHLIEKSLRDHRSRFDEFTGVTRLPVACIQMPPSPNERDFYEELLVGLRTVLPNGLSVTALRHRARVLARQLEVRIVAKANGGDFGLGWNLIVLHHTDCGITRLVHSPELLAKHFGVAPADLDGLAIADPHKAVTIDVAALKGNPLVPGGFLVTGLVYDVTTGRIEIVGVETRRAGL